MKKFSQYDTMELYKTYTEHIMLKYYMIKAIDKIKCLFNKKHSCEAVRNDWELYANNIMLQLSENELIIDDAWVKMISTELSIEPYLEFNQISCDYNPKCYRTFCDIQQNIHNEIIEINKRIKSLNSKINIIKTYYSMNTTHKKVHTFTAKNDKLYFLGYIFIGDKDIEVQCKNQNGKIVGSANMELEIDGRTHLSTLDIFDLLSQRIGIGTQLFHYCVSVIKGLDDYMPTVRFSQNTHGQPIKVIYGGMIRGREYLKDFYRKCGCDISGWSFKKQIL